MMNLKRILAFVLSLCMILSLAPVGTVAHAQETVSGETAAEQDLVIQELDSDEVNVDLTLESAVSSDLALEQEVVDEEGNVPVFIIMEGESILEEDAAAVVNEDTQAKSEELVEAQSEVVAEIEATVLEGEELEVTYHYTWLVNGVAATIPYNAMADIEAVKGVEKVVVQPIYQIFEDEVTAVEDVSTLTISDGVMVGRESAWAEGYTGRGIKIAVIDTGLDLDHQNFGELREDALTEDSADKDTVAAVLDQLNASARYSGLTAEDVYHSSKVVYAFNYSDDTIDVTHANDEQGDHGTHVAGIAAANKVDECAVVGVAPDAQLYILKVFGAQRAGYSSDIVAALEDALILGADVVNMSLGSPAGFTSSASDFVNEIYARVADTGTVLAISAGNNYTAGFSNLWGTDLNLTENIDNAVIGEPAIYSTSLSVAAVENWKVQRNYIQVSDGYQMGFVETSASYGIPSVLTLEGEYGLVAIPGYGEAADYEGLDVTGKVVLVSRGTISFPEKLTYASAAGAAACIVYNNASGEIYMDLTGTEGTIPCVSITMADGAYLLAALEADPAVSVSFPEDLAAIPSADAYEMSEFSSWGVAPDLSLEPDIAAPGGNIYSTIDDGQYGLMSGTSMAAPNIAGMSALVMQYARETFEGDWRTMVQNLLMSTSVPLNYDAELYYSPRQQGSGLANVYNAVVTDTYLTVEGVDVPKVELGQDPDKTGSYAFAFDVNNFGENRAFYALSTVAQTEGVAAYGDIYFMSGTPVALGAETAEDSGALVLTHDVDDDTDTDSHDAYLIYQAATGNGAQGWESESFRYDTTRDDGVAADDVQAYLDALVGNESVADLADESLCVMPGETAQVTVTVELDSDSRAYLDAYFPNGGYVEGYTFLTARNEGAVDLSLPYLGFYGNWDDAPMIDNGDYWDLLNAAEGEVVGNQYWNVLWTNFYGQASYYYPGANVYVDEPVDPAHISVSPNGDGYFDTVDDIYTSLLRNAAELTYRYSNAETGEVYYEQTARNVSKSVYSSGYGQIVPTVYSWFEGEIELYNWVDAEGNDLENNEKLLLEIEALGAYEGATPDTWSVPITVDLEAPKLLNASRVEDPDTGKVTLVLTFKDNLSVSVVGVMNGDGSEVYYMEPVADVEPDEYGYQNYTVAIDITGLTGKLMIVLGDYAMNESYYGINAGGEGTPYGELVGYSYSVEGGSDGWVSFSEGVNADETMIFMEDSNVVCAEYVGGYVFAQTETGALYGFRYEDMLKDTFSLESTYIAQLDNVYQDLAYSYVEGKLFGLLTTVDDGYPTSEIYSINLKGAYYDEDNWMDVAAYQEDWFANRGGIYGLTFAIDDAGTMYILANNYDWDTEAMTDTAYLWAAEREVSSDRWGTYVDYIFANLGSTGITMNYLQSMTWDHNSEQLYWARFDAVGLSTVGELYVVDPSALDDVTDEEGNVTGQVIHTEQVGTLSGEVCALFAPLSEEAAAKEAHLNLPEMDSSVVGTPILRDDVITMNFTGSKKLAYDLDPWYTDHKSVVWSSDNESVVQVDADGVIYCVGEGSAVVTVANADDETKFDTVTVEVTALDLVIEGVVTAQAAGIGNATGVSTYKFEMVDGISQFGTVNAITAPDEMNYGLSLATSTYGRGSIWACEYGNTGMIYQIDPATGVVQDVLEPIDGDMLFGMSYSEQEDTFTAIMNMYLFVDLKLTHEETEEILGTYDEELSQFTYHRINLLPYLTEAGGSFVTGENGNGASSEIVFCGVTTIPGGESQYMYMDYMGGWGPEISYVPTQTLVLLDNVGRLWFIDEIKGMTYSVDEYGNEMYTGEDGSMVTPQFHGVEVMADGTGTYSAFVIRELAETPLTTMFVDGTMPRITYHFSDIELAGFTADGAPMIVMSLYDYWNNGTTNELYLYIPGVGTGEFTYDDNWNYVEIKTADRMYNLGNTGENNIIASVHSASVTGGVELPVVDNVQTEAEYVEELGINTLSAGAYSAE